MTIIFLMLSFSCAAENRLKFELDAFRVIQYLEIGHPDLMISKYFGVKSSIGPLAIVESGLAELEYTFICLFSRCQSVLWMSYTLALLFGLGFLSVLVYLIGHKALKYGFVPVSENLKDILRPNLSKG